MIFRVMRKNLGAINFVLFIFGLFQVCFAEKGNIYHNPDGHFSFLIPEGWQEISREVIIERHKEICKKAEELFKIYKIPGKPILPDAEFQKIDKEYSKLPVMLFIRPTKDISGLKQELQYYLKSKEYKKVKEKLKGKPNPTFLDFVLLCKFDIMGSHDEMVYDTAGNMFIINTASSAGSQDKGLALVINVRAFYKCGTVLLSFHTNEKDLQNDLIYFEQIINSFKFDEGYRYQEGTK